MDPIDSKDSIDRLNPSDTSIHQLFVKAVPATEASGKLRPFMSHRHLYINDMKCTCVFLLLNSIDAISNYMKIHEG